MNPAPYEAAPLEIRAASLSLTVSPSHCEVLRRVALRITRPTETAKPLPCRLRRVALVIVKPAPGFAAEPARFDIFNEKRAGAVFAVGEPLIEHLHDREAGVEPDEIGQFERPHRMVCAKLHR